MRAAWIGLVTAVASGGALAACGSSTTSTSADGPPAADARVPDAPPPDAAPPDAAPPTTLTLTLDPSLDGDGDIKASSLTAAVLLDKSGAMVAQASIVGGDAVFDIHALAAGDFFIEVNGDADDLVPTHLDGVTTSVEQRVGQKLRASMIGPAADPTYRINTYSAGQGEGPAVKFSDGTPLDGEQPYAFITLKMPKLELKVLGTAAALSSTSTAPATAIHPGSNVPFDAWILNTGGQAHHGDAYNDDPISCAMCHANMMMKPAMWSSTMTTAGWCYHCHNGPTGDASGFVDPTK